MGITGKVLENYDQYMDFVKDIRETYNCKYHHSATRRGYVSRKIKGIAGRTKEDLAKDITFCARDGTQISIVPLNIT